MSFENWKKKWSFHNTNDWIVITGNRSRAVEGAGGASPRQIGILCTSGEMWED